MKPTTLRSRLLRAALLSGAMLAGTAHAQITIFKQPNFTGGDMTLRGDASSLASSGFNDQASSLVVRSGQWEVCTQPDFRGDCVTLDRGEYPSLDPRINHRIESVRQVGRYAQRGGDNRYPSVALYARPGFRGRTMQLDRDAGTLEGTDFDYGGPSSLIVNEGRWQLCTDPGYAGACRVYEPGRYPDLGRFNNQISSLRRIG